MKKFIEELRVSDAELKNLKITGVHETNIKQHLMEVYNVEVWKEFIDFISFIGKVK